ncbi:hypothetical protein ACFLQQ_00060 [Actinomycetota bacterium]
MDNQELYNKHFVQKAFEREDLFEAIQNKYGCRSALYPGSFIHITPSFIFPEVIYVDSDSQAKRFFKNIKDVIEIINSKKQYPEKSNIIFFGQSYLKPLPTPVDSIDLLISQYAGFVSMYCKKYLKKGGILLVNGSHGDAAMARLDKDYKFIAAVKKQGENYGIIDRDLDSYFIPKKPIKATRSYLEKTKRGIGYTKSAMSYIFKKGA